MNPEQQTSILAIALLAAFADGSKDDRERERIRRLAESLADEARAPDLARLYQDVLLKRVTLAGAAAAIDDPDHRQLAYEMAVCVCDADGRQSDAERRFLADLQATLGLDAAQTATVEREGEALRVLDRPHRRPVHATRSLHRAMMDGKYHRVTLPERHDFRPRLHARTLLS